MSEIFAMQRANGDWFALEDDGRLRVPLFHSIHDAMIARLRNFGLLLFKPVVLDALVLKELAPSPGEDEVYFSLVDDPFASLNDASLIGRSELSLLILQDENETIRHNPNILHASGSGASSTPSGLI